ncbi:hypothetical protein RclHR1_35390001 [Rhizophagus clarus]|uniref:DNA-directed DNA polymerase n=1 Tax=Rhizophagus clarus TaxID=94130 RepID=A0A2Z6RSJ0_9GLOM|nr:hypothetical protein RclHR1_35390001 [Rhizophagus clarus]
MAFWLFEKLSVGIPTNEPLDTLETQWISKAMMGGIIWAQNNWKEYGRRYDETSLYPSIQQLALNFSIGKGKFQILKDFTNHRGYSHNGAPNALIYEKETRIQGKVIFGEYVDFLFKIKNQGGIVSQVAKRILNTLWGALCQRKKTYKTLTTSSNPFKGEYPRIALFLLAHGRKITSETVQPYIDKVRRIHTDGFILEEDVNNSPLYTYSKDAFKTLKALKFEREGECSNKKMKHDLFPFTNKYPSFIKHETYLAEIIEALKNVILADLRDGYDKESYLIKNHVNYIKKIESANNPEGYIHYTAKKLLPNKESHAEKKIPPRRKLNENEAKDILAELLSNKP